MPFVFILIGAGLGKLIELAGTRNPKHFAVTVAVVAMFIIHIDAIRSKTTLMRQNGERAATLLNAIEPYLKLIPRDGQLVLLNPTSHEVEYSVFRMAGFNVLDDGLGRLKQIAGRNDMDVKIISESSLESHELSADA